jgi:hypothetical protein
MHRLQELVRLHRMGTGSRTAARMLKMEQPRDDVQGGTRDELPHLLQLVQQMLECASRLRHVPV